MEFTTILQAAEAEFTEKKSRFIGRAYPVETEEEARVILERTRKEHWDASHNVFAYRVGLRPEIQRFSDDGEPGGTAGMPMLEVLRGESVQNTLVIVTRYFGGVLLGTGGLVRAYTRGAQEAVRAAGIIRKEICCRYCLSIEYTQLGKLQYTLAKEDYVTESVDYTEQVELTVIVPQSRKNSFLNLLTEAGEGKFVPRCRERGWAARREGQYVFFPDSRLLLPEEGES